MSVFAAWGTSISALPHDVASFLYLLCFLDRTNLSKDMFRRACSPKRAWLGEGNLSLLLPAENGVPSWLSRLLCDDAGQWDGLRFNDAVQKLSSFFFVHKEVLNGTWLHASGPVESSSLTSDRSTVTLLKLPQPFHDLGKYYHNTPMRRQFCYDAISVVFHSFRNEVSAKVGGQIKASPVMYVGRGGTVDDAGVLLRQLEEVHGHVSVIENVMKPMIPRKHQRSCFDGGHPPWYVGEVVMFASRYWPELRAREKASFESPLLSVLAWEAILDMADFIIPLPESERQQGLRSTPSGTWSIKRGQPEFEPKFTAIWHDGLAPRRSKPQFGFPVPYDAFTDMRTAFDSKWTVRNVFYIELLFRSETFTEHDLWSPRKVERAIERIASTAETLIADPIQPRRVAGDFATENLIRSQRVYGNYTIRQLIRDSMGKNFTEGWNLSSNEEELAFCKWISSPLGLYFRQRARM